MAFFFSITVVTDLIAYIQICLIRSFEHRCLPGSYDYFKEQNGQKTCPADIIINDLYSLLKIECFVRLLPKQIRNISSLGADQTWHRINATHLESEPEEHDEYEETDEVRLKMYRFNKHLIELQDVSMYEPINCDALNPKKKRAPKRQLDDDGEDSTIATATGVDSCKRANPSKKARKTKLAALSVDGGRSSTPQPGDSSSSAPPVLNADDDDSNGNELENGGEPTSDLTRTFGKFTKCSVTNKQRDLLTKSDWYVVATNKAINTQKTKCTFCFERETGIKLSVGHSDLITSVCLQCRVMTTHDYLSDNPKFDHRAIMMRLLNQQARPVVFYNADTGDGRFARGDYIEEDEFQSLRGFKPSREYYLRDKNTLKVMKHKLSAQDIARMSRN